MRKVINISIFFTCLAIIICIICFYSSRETKLLVKHGRFAIGVTNGVSGSLISPSLTYYFKFNGKTFYSSTGVVDKKALGHRFYVVFYEKDPNKARLLLFYPVPKGIKEAPKDGWKTMPEVDYSLRDSLNLDIYKEESNENLKESEWK